MTSPGLERAEPVTEVTVFRQPVVRPDRSVRGYAVRVVVRGPLALGAHDELDALVHAEFEKLDLAALAGGNVVFVRATTGMLTSDWPLPDTPGGLFLEVPREFCGLPDAAAHLARLRAAGVGLALVDFVPGGAQDALLARVDCVKVDLARGDAVVADAVAHAHRCGLVAIAERVNSEAAVRFCTANAVDFLQGPLFQRDATPVAREFTAGELQCLELIALLSVDEIDLGRAIRVVDSDPELVMRVLGLVNSSAIGIRRHVDSVREAVMLLGPQSLGALAAASRIDARGHTITGLWFLLTRAVACRFIAGDDVAYTVGLLSAVAAQMHVAPAELIARTGVSHEVGNALLTRTGPYGPVLAAVLAHEENDTAGVEATGLAPFDVARAYIDAVADALGTATALLGTGG